LDVVTYDSPSVFNAALSSHLDGRPGENELMLGLVRVLMDNPGHFGATPFLATVNDHGKPVLAAFMTSPWSILVYSDRTVKPEVFDRLQDHLLANDITIPGVNGMREQSEEFSRRWCKRTGMDRRVKMEMRLHVLREVQDVPVAKGELVKAGPDLSELLVDWSMSFNAETGLEMENDFVVSHVRHIIEKGAAFVWMDRGPVSMAFLERPHERSVSVGYVYTPAELGGRGYATSCVAALSRGALNDGYAYLSLFTDISNPVSNSIYRKIGYRPVCDYVLYDFL